jgi:hypothetical protein
MKNFTDGQDLLPDTAEVVTSSEVPVLPPVMSVTVLKKLSSLISGKDPNFVCSECLLLECPEELAVPLLVTLTMLLPVLLVTVTFTPPIGVLPRRHSLPNLLFAQFLLCFSDQLLVPLEMELFKSLLDLLTVTEPLKQFGLNNQPVLLVMLPKNGLLSVLEVLLLLPPVISSIFGLNKVLHVLT